MRHLVTLFALFPLVSWCASSEASVELSAFCKEDDPCRAIDGMIDVEPELFNAGTDAVSLSVEYFRKQGPKVILVDNRSGKERRLSMGPPRSYPFDQMQELAPGQAVRIPWMVAPDETDDFAPRPVDITIVFVFDLTPRAPLGEKLFVRAPLHITGGRVGEP